MTATIGGTHGLRGLRAAVLGSTSGIGRAVALELAEGGAAVIVHGHRSRDRADEVADLAVRRVGFESQIRAALDAGHAMSDPEVRAIVAAMRQ